MTEAGKKLIKAAKEARAMTQWKAAPSPSGDEEEVERVARAMYNARIAGKKSYSEFDDLVTNGYPDIYHQELDNARAAIAAMRPTLSEEDRAQLKINVAWYQANEKRFGAWCHDPDDGQTAFDMLGEALSLIDKLAGEG